MVDSPPCGLKWSEWSGGGLGTSYGHVGSIRATWLWATLLPLDLIGDRPAPGPPLAQPPCLLVLWRLLKCSLVLLCSPLFDPLSHYWVAGPRISNRVDAQRRNKILMYPSSVVLSQVLRCSGACVFEGLQKRLLRMSLYDAKSSFKAVTTN